MIPMATVTADPTVSSTHREPRSRRLQALRVARFELLRQLRRRRMVLLLAIAGIVAAALFAVLQFFGPDGGTAYTYASTYANSVTILAALAATFFGADALLGEFEQRTGYVLFPQPVTRSSVFLGKLLAASGLASMTLAAYYAIMAGATWFVMGTVPVEMAYSFLLALLYTTAALGLAFLLSSALKSTTMSSVLTFALLLFVLTIVTTIFTVADVRPVGNLAFAGQTIPNILAGPYPEGYPGDVTINFGPGGGFTQFSPAVESSVAVMGVRAIVCFGLALFLYRRREMKG